MRISKHTFATSAIKDHFIVDAAGIGGRKKLLPGEVLLVEIQPGEVTRGHISCGNEPGTFRKVNLEVLQKQ
jgi:hypothetical protein